MEHDPIAVTVIGNDRPGIVAGVSRVLFELGCNLEDVTSTILRGHFAMMLVVDAADHDAAAVEQALAPVGEELALTITARPVEEIDASVAEPTHMISVYGADHPGIVYRVSQLLADLGANVTDLTSRVIGDEDHPVYALMMEVVLAPGAELESALARLREDLQVDISVNPIDAAIL